MFFSEAFQNSKSYHYWFPLRRIIPPEVGGVDAISRIVPQEGLLDGSLHEQFKNNVNLKKRFFVREYFFLR
jgi:hypothetical protein